MKFLLYLLLGYSVLETDTADFRALLNFCNRSGIRLRRIREGETAVLVWVLAADERKLQDFFARRSVKCRVCARHGLPILWRRYRHRVGLLLGLLVFTAAVYTAPLFVWEVNVDGLDRLSREYVCELLAEEGVRVGAFSPGIDRSRVYINVLRRAPDISWLSVNLRGSTANVEIIERDAPPASRARADGANLIAARGGQIIGADVVRGALAVQNGEIVKPGALLVSGVIDSQTVGTRYLYAEGCVYAAVYDDYTVEIPLTRAVRRYDGEKTLEMSLSVFGKSINIFKNYSIPDDNYDTIYRESSLPYPGLCRLPLALLTTVALPYTETPQPLSETAALERARAELLRQIAEKKTYAGILSREEAYAVSDGVLVYRCSVGAIENIAAVAEFDIRGR